MGQSKPFRPTAVLVEDDPIQREMIALLLEETDYNVIRCEDGETAELALKNRHPAVLITDVSLVGAICKDFDFQFLSHINLIVNVVMLSAGEILVETPG